ncbi:glycosyltransferase [Reichenbachiella ulvae]|uniref:Glycosyltransferase n=1 Tax=Reichenbachiella ulvae TaxID=2980104 RepID=A0ABT3D0X0_9BACT|nr:glycosyltransferase [Reichenbachiella ulvae]MCV9389474.1 glycosyltransferase [Reichenbachiella ulvae]
MDLNQNREEIIYPPIVCLGFTPWNGNYAKSTTQLINRLARNHEIIYVDYQFTFKDVLYRFLGKSDLDVGPIIGTKKSLRVERTDQGTDVNVLSLPPVFPINWIDSESIFRFGLKVNSWLIRRKIKSAVKKMKWDKIAFVSAYNPFFALDSVGKLNEALHCYYCYDEISGSPWAQKYGAGVELDYMKMVDMIFVSSRTLQKSKAKTNPNCELIQNGVDFKFFNDYYIQNGYSREPDKVVIGYVGSLDERIDYALIRKIAEQFSDAEVRLIGRVVYPDLLEEIRGVENIKLIGALEYEKLPKELSKFNVGLIPFLKTVFTKNIYPLKINEYLAMALPVVKSNFSELPEFDSLVYTGDTHEEFIASVERALDEPDRYLMKERIDMASSNSWDFSVAKMSRLISEKFN